MPNWTRSQENAINAKNSNILVSAAAGSGKTAVLVERVINKLLSKEEDVNIDELLIVTFTNSAAAEMKARISDALSTIIKKEPHNNNAIKQLSLIPNAQICTIDSFCINLVRENFFKLEIEQDFRILDNSEAMLIEEKAIDDIVEELYENNDEHFKNLVELLSTTKNDTELINTVKRLHNYISSQPFELEWLEQTGELYNPEISIDDSVIREYIIEEIRFCLDYVSEVINYEKSILEYDEMYEAYSAVLEKDEITVSKLYSSLEKPWDELCADFENISFEAIPRAKAGFNPPYKSVLLEKRKVYNSSTSIFNRTILPLLCANEEDIRKDNEYLYSVFGALIDLVKRYNQSLLEIKKELNSYTFSDIEHFAIDLLFYKNAQEEVVRTDLAKELEKRYKEILVDEYQDTNAAQDLLFTMLSNGKNLFMVGDVKQSIYRFRLAMPAIFNHKKDTFKLYSPDETNTNQKIILDKNFRSRKEICDFTNFIFSKLMSRKIGELEYNGEEYLYNGADYPETQNEKVRINIVDVPQNEDKVEFEARQCASMILKKIAAREQVSDKGKQRNISFGDFAVLLRSTKNTMPKYTKVFSEYGIPTVSNNRINLFDNNEVSILVSFLRVIDNPVQDVPLLATLMSVFYGYSADEIASARVKLKTGNLYSAICNDNETFSAFLNDLERYKKYAATMSVEGFIRLLLSESSYLSLISVMGNCEQRRLNVYKLIDFAKSFDHGENVGLTAFIRYVDSIIEAGLEIESAEVSASGNNCVQIMSVHKSKGLEFPVVILADTAHQYNAEDERANVLLNHEAGVGLKVYNKDGLYRYNSVQYDAIRILNSNAAMSENLRVLYVAITRAKEQFIAFASYNNAESKIDKIASKILHSKINPFIIKKTNNDAELLIMCALLHQNCTYLRSLCTSEIIADNSFNFSMSAEICNYETSIEREDKEEIKPDSLLVEKIRDALSFEYDGYKLRSFSSKRNASSLDDREHSFKYFAKTKPAFLSNNNLTAAQKGTAMHEFMQYCDYYRAKSSLEEEILRLYENGFLTELQADSLNREKLNNLFNSDFAKRMFESDRLFREMKVSSFVPLNTLENTDSDEKILVQGIADCVFEEDGKLVLVDYKTDYVKTEEELLELYKNQIAFYKYAISKTLNKEVKEAMLYSFALDKPCVYKN